MTAGLQLMARDRCLLDEFAEVGLLDTATIHARHFAADRTGEACRRRLRRLSEHELIRSLPPLVTYAEQRSGRLPTVHCLTLRGAEAIAEFTGSQPRRIFRRDPKPETILHRLGVARMQLLVKDACLHARLPSPVWILEHDTHPGVRVDAPLAERFVLYESYATDAGVVSCRPDASCWLRVLGVDQSVHHLVVYWEFDRSTEPLKQFVRKMPGYHALLAANACAKHWPNTIRPTVCVFVVTPSHERRDHLAECVREHAGGAAFRFACERDLQPKTFFAGPIWLTTGGEARPILRTPLAAA